ncbi:MAG TPA: hypothetical protein VE011_09420 [Candidatus Dormibacteraeota bacterium]|nr:hypothetical protein [Candidatus Dormibacteraeota bacterium]
MAMWHCPHCGALQTEAARCWVCRRSSTTCSTCRNFRRSLATDVGFCSLDRRRRPLTGLELRGCWAGRPAAVATTHGPTVAHLAEGLPVVRGFVPVDEVTLPVAVPAPATLEAPVPPVAFVEAAEAPTSLFGDAER